MVEKQKITNGMKEFSDLTYSLFNDILDGKEKCEDFKNKMKSFNELMKKLSIDVCNQIDSDECNCDIYLSSKLVDLMCSINTSWIALKKVDKQIKDINHSLEYLEEANKESDSSSESEDENNSINKEYHSWFKKQNRCTLGCIRIALNKIDKHTKEIKKSIIEIENSTKDSSTKSESSSESDSEINFKSSFNTNSAILSGTGQAR